MFRNNTSIVIRWLWRLSSLKSLKQCSDTTHHGGCHVENHPTWAAHLLSWILMSPSSTAGWLSQSPHHVVAASLMNMLAGWLASWLGHNPRHLAARLCLLLPPRPVAGDNPSSLGAPNCNTLMCVEDTTPGLTSIRLFSQFTSHWTGKTTQNPESTNRKTKYKYNIQLKIITKEIHKFTKHFTISTIPYPGRVGPGVLTAGDLSAEWREKLASPSAG